MFKKRELYDPQLIPYDLGGLILKRRQELRLSRNDVEKHTGISPTALAKIENENMAYGKAEKLVKLADILKIPLRSMFRLVIMKKIENYKKKYNKYIIAGGGTPLTTAHRTTKLSVTEAGMAKNAGQKLEENREDCSEHIQFKARSLERE